MIKIICNFNQLIMGLIVNKQIVNSIFLNLCTEKSIKLCIKKVLNYIYFLCIFHIFSK